MIFANQSSVEVRKQQLYRVTNIELVGPNRLQVGIDDGTQQTIDFLPILKGPVFGSLRDPDLFAQAAIDTEIQTLAWPNGADFDPEILHTWPLVKEALIERAKSWVLSPV